MNNSKHVFYAMIACVAFVVLGGRVFAADPKGESEPRVFAITFNVADIRTTKTNPSTEDIKKNFKFFLGTNFEKREAPVNAAVAKAVLGIVNEGGTLNVLYADKEGNRFGKEGLKAWSNETVKKDSDLQTLRFPVMNSKKEVIAEIVIALNVVFDEKSDSQFGWVAIVVADPDQIPTE